MKNHSFSRVIALIACLMLLVSAIPFAAQAASFDEAVTGDYYNVLSTHEYTLAPGATETEMILNNDEGSRRQILHVMEVDPKNPTIQILPGYYAIDKLAEDNADIANHKTSPLTETVKYYEDTLGYNVVGAMNTHLSYTDETPRGYMVLNGQLMFEPVLPASQITGFYLVIDKEGNPSLHYAGTYNYTGEENTILYGSFAQVVKDGQLVSKTPERTSSPASRSMIGIKADGTVVFCETDGRNAPIATGLSNYEMGEMMLALGCVNAYNCDGGGSSTFITKREGEETGTMRSTPSDGSERATLNSVMIVSTARPTGVFDHSTIEADYDYMVPFSAYQFSAFAVDDAGYEMDMPADVTWALSDASFGTIENGLFTSNGTLGTVDAQMIYNGNVVGSKTINVVNPDVFKFTADATVIPYGKSIELEILATYGSDAIDVYIGNQYALAISDTTSATLEGNKVTATTDESKKGIVASVTYLPNPEVVGTIDIGFGKGSEIVYDFEDGDVSQFMSFDEAKQWTIDNGVTNTLTTSEPVDGQYSVYADGSTFLATRDNGGQVKNGEYALGWNIDNTDAEFAEWTYNILFKLGVPEVLRDTTNGKNATTFGMWVYIPEGAEGLALQLQHYAGTSAETAKGTSSHFYFTSASTGKSITLNSAKAADIPESRWVYASVNLTANNYVALLDPTKNIWKREPSFIRTYVKPDEPAVHTFYFDDFTLDYSSAVEDRIAPTITNPEYAQSPDTLVALNEGATLVTHDANKLIHGFYATVSDNVALDATTRQIYIDGVAVSTSLSGNKMYSSYHYLTNGTHTVTFEIADRLGNYSRLTRTFTFKDGNFDVTLGGHNNTGAPAEYGSIYYVDINVSDLAGVDKLTTTLKLQNANTWETGGAVVAPGFKATFDFNENSDLLDVVIEKTGAVASGEGTIVSIPVRLWTWSGIDHTTGNAVTTEAIFKTTYCPVVTIDCEVVYGNIEGKNFDTSNMGAFGGSISVATNLNDNINPWHSHEAVALEDKAATCTEDGYTGRTYCEGCASVVEWGTIEPATGHIYTVIDGYYACACGEVNKVTGSYYVDGAYRYFSAGELQTGWKMIETDWYYFRSTTQAAQPGYYTLNGIRFQFEENGKLIAGVWQETSNGFRYWYGPGYYGKGWQTINGDSYFFDENGCRVTGIYCVRLQFHNDPVWYEFDENGVMIGKVQTQGFFVFEGKTYYLTDGVGAKGLKLIDGDYYYFHTNDGTMATNGYYFTYETNGVLEEGTYYFGDDGKMTTPKDGIIAENGGLYYYVDGVLQKGVGMIEIDGDYYFVRSNGQLATGSYNTYNNNGLVANGVYYFDPVTGKLMPKNGIIAENGGLFYYVDNVIQLKAGMIEIDGDYYFVRSNGQLATGSYKTYNNNGLMPNGTYYFDKVTGKLIIPEEKIVAENGGLYYYVDGVLQKGAGMIKLDGEYYFVRSNGQLATGIYKTYNNNGLMPDGEYEFDKETGKMIIVRDGIVYENGGLYYYIDTVLQKGAGMIEIDGDYYFVRSNGQLATGYYKTYNNNGLMANGTYFFDYETGKLSQPKNGIVAENGGLYYYVDGAIKKGAGMIEIDGDYYFVRSNGQLATGSYNTYKNNGLMDNGTYTFDAETGKLIK